MSDETAYALSVFALCSYMALVVSWVWEWHVVPLGAKRLPWASALALLFLVAILFADPSPGGLRMDWQGLKDEFGAVTMAFLFGFLLSQVREVTP